MSPPIFLVFLSSFLLITHSHASHVPDFCVADITGPQSPTGYSCKDPTKVTVDDFVYSGLGVRSNATSKIFNFTFTAAFNPTLPGLNGLGVSISRADLGTGGVVPMHSHPGATELVIVMEGSSIIGGFIDSNNTVYQKILSKGDVMVLPQGLYHYFVNKGNSPAVIYASFSSEAPTVQTLDTLLFKNNLATDIIANTTLLDVGQIKKLKRQLNGTN